MYLLSWCRQTLTELKQNTASRANGGGSLNYTLFTADVHMGTQYFKSCMSYINHCILQMWAYLIFRNLEQVFLF